nr:unnamed protein product [Callosobruchus chinensis]
MTQDMFFNIKSACYLYFLSTPRPSLSLRQARLIEVSVDSPYVKSRETYTGAWTQCVVRNKKKLANYIHLNPLYDAKLKISADKIKNITDLATFLKKPESVPFYRSFSITETTSNIDLDEEDNSDGCD